MTSVTPLTLAGAAAVVLLGGCAHELNHRTTLGGSTRIEALSATDATAPADASPTRTTSLDRGDWQAVTFLVPVDGTVHAPTWKGSRLHQNDDTPRAKGLAPTPDSALDLHASDGTLIAEGLIAVPLTLVDMAFVPLRAIAEPVWSKRQSPQWFYKRSDQQDGWSAGVLPGEPDAPAAATAPERADG